jgi:hypothetical protein
MVIIVEQENKILEFNYSDAPLSAYDLAKLQGYPGTLPEWIESLKGQDGEKGEKGDKGDKGDTFEHNHNLNDLAEKSYNSLTDKPMLFSGSYTDLSNKPTIPTALSDLSPDTDNQRVSVGEKSTWNAKENAIGAKGTAFNKNFGTTSGTVCEGNDNRLTDARTPTAHSHNLDDLSEKNFSSLANKPTSIGGYGITDAYTKTEIDNKISSVYKYKGSVATYANLPTENRIVGDVYNVIDTGINYAWDGTAWDDIGGVEALATALNNGLMSKEDFAKLRDITGSNTGDQDLSNLQPKEVGKGLSENDLTNALKTNYDTAYTHSQTPHAPAGATVNATDAQLRDRATHTGSQAISTITNLQTTLDNKASLTDWGTPKGGMRFDGVDDYIKLPLSIDASTDNVFTFEINIKSDELRETRFISYLEGGGTVIGYESDGRLVFFDVGFGYRFTDVFLEVGKYKHIVLTNNNNEMKVYADGKYIQTHNTNSFMFKYGAEAYIGRLGFSNGHKGDINIYRYFNYALPESKIKKYYNNGRPDLAELDYEDLKGSNVNLVRNGTFDSDTEWVKESEWTISNGYANYTPAAGVSSGIRQFGNQLPTSNIIKIKFRIISGTARIIFTNAEGYPLFSGFNNYVASETPYEVIGTVIPNPVGFGIYAQEGLGGTAFSIDNIEIIPLGCTFEIKPDGWGRLGVFDSQNGNHGTTFGNPISLTSEQRENIYRDIKTNITGNTTLTNVVPKGYKIKSLIIDNKGDATTCSISYFKNGWVYIVSNETTPFGLKELTLAESIFSLDNSETLYFSGAGQFDLYFIFEKIGG